MGYLLYGNPNRQAPVATLNEAVEEYHDALRELVKGNPAPIRMFSQRDDVVLCNPFHPFARGPSEVAETTREAASHFSQGVVDFEQVVMFATPELGYIVEIERFKALLDGKEASGALRVTTIFRLEEGTWRVAHRHADAVTSPRPIESIVNA